MSLNAAQIAILIGTAVTAVGTVSSIRSQRAALDRENFRLKQEAEMARLAAIEEENNRLRNLRETLANNRAFASIAGYYDDSASNYIDGVDGIEQFTVNSNWPVGSKNEELISLARPSLTPDPGVSIVSAS